MANKASWECIHLLCFEITNCFELPFGGIPFIGCSDFHQVAPVGSRGGETATLAASVKSSPLWQKMIVHTLRTPVCTITDPDFTDFIAEVGENYSRK